MDTLAKTWCQLHSFDSNLIVESSGHEQYGDVLFIPIVMAILSLKLQNGYTDQKMSPYLHHSILGESSL